MDKTCSVLEQLVIGVASCVRQGGGIESIACGAYDHLQLISLIYVININFTILWFLVCYSLCVTVNINLYVNCFFILTVAILLQF